MRVTLLTIIPNNLLEEFLSSVLETQTPDGLEVLVLKEKVFPLEKQQWFH